MAGGFYFDKVWIEGSAFDVAGSAMVAEVGWMGTFSSIDEGLASKVSDLEKSQEPVAVAVKPVGFNLRLYGRALVRPGAAGALGWTTVVLSGALGTHLTTQPQ